MLFYAFDNVIFLRIKRYPQLDFCDDLMLALIMTIFIIYMIIIGSVLMDEE